MHFDDQSILRAFTCYWRIKNFHLCKPKKNLFLRSPTFQIEDFSKSNWHLEIRQKEADFMSIYIFLEKAVANIPVNVSIYLHTNKRWKPILTKCAHNFIENGAGFGDRRLASWAVLNRDKEVYLPGNSLTVCIVLSKSVVKSAQCFIVSEMISEKDLINTSVQEYKFIKPSDFFKFDHPSESQPIENAMNTKKVEKDDTFDENEDLIQSFKDKKFQFVTLLAGDRTFIVHKALLSAGSPVFNELLDHKVGENRIVVNLGNIDGDTLSELLQFLHFQPLSKDLRWHEAAKLYFAAEKYQIHQLKDKCTMLLKKNISLENVCEAFVLADRLKSDEIYACALEYICKNSRTIFRSPEWKSFMIQKTELASEILSKMADKL